MESEEIDQIPPEGLTLSQFVNLDKNVWVKTFFLSMIQKVITVKTLF